MINLKNNKGKLLFKSNKVIYCELRICFITWCCLTPKLLVLEGPQLVWSRSGPTTKQSDLLGFTKT